MYMLHTAVWEVWVGASLCMKLHFCHGCSCDSHFYVEPIVDNVTGNCLGTCTTISCRTSPSPRSHFWISISTKVFIIRRIFWVPAPWSRGSRGPRGSIAHTTTVWVSLQVVHSAVFQASWPAQASFVLGASPQALVRLSYGLFRWWEQGECGADRG